MNAHLLGIEERGWEALSSPDPRAFCEQWLADDAVIVVPGAVIDRATFLAALTHERPWTWHRIEDPRTVELTEGAAVLMYRVVAQREDHPEFVGLLSSVYASREGRWQLVLHQQTPAHVPG
ncbi:MAG: nuclear transport factor 2 family protein [Actinobacteria bacterium]|nr:nuclear transport factor 2 family protein [Actinomycetota bacterium]